MIPVLLGVLLIVFTISHFMPGDPVISVLGTEFTEEEYVAKKHEMGLDKSYFEQFFNYVYKLVTRGDLGTSYATSQPVANEIHNRIWISLAIGVLGLLVTALIGIPFGILSATKQYSVWDYSVTVAAMFFASVPGFWLALMMMIVFALKLRWLPASGITTWKHYIMPVLCNAMMSVASTTRMTRSSMLECIRQDYIRTARAKGLKESAVIWKHALKNALIPVITMIGGQMSMLIGGSVIVESIYNIPGMGLQERVVVYKHALVNALIPVITIIGSQVGALVGGSVVVETIFSIPGMGMYLMTSISTRDFPAIMGVVVVLSVFASLANLLVDIIYSLADPRIKAQFAGTNRNRKKKSESGEVEAAA